VMPATMLRLLCASKQVYMEQCEPLYGDSADRGLR